LRKHGKRLAACASGNTSSVNGSMDMMILANKRADSRQSARILDSRSESWDGETYRSRCCESGVWPVAVLAPTRADSLADSPKRVDSLGWLALQRLRVRFIRKPVRPIRPEIFRDLSPGHPTRSQAVRDKGYGQRPRFRLAVLFVLEKRCAFPNDVGQVL